MEIDISRQADMGGVVHNAFGEYSLFGINRNVFHGTDASTVFRSHFGEQLFREDTYHLIAGTDSGLLCQYVKMHGVPKGSRYLFIELPQVLTLFKHMDDPQMELAITTGEDWLKHDEIKEIEKYALLGRLTLHRSLAVVHGHCSDYPPFWRKLKREYDTFRQNLYNIVQLRPFIVCQIENLAENQVPALFLKDTFKGKTAVVLAGGPSLDALLPWVRQHRRNLLVIAVSRISRSLLQANIQPDISVSVDPQAINLNVCKELLEFEEGTLLVNNYHLSPNLLASWGGQKVFVGARYPWHTSLQPENIPSCGGTTVTNTALDLAVKTGVAQVVLGGADFCFNQAGYTHAKGTAEQAIGPMLQICELQVETNGGMMADTENGYLESGNFFDSQAKDAMAHGCRVINPAPGAMRLPNVKHLPLDSILVEPMEHPAREIITNSIPSTNVRTRAQLYNEVLGELDRILKELVAIKALSNKALKYNGKVLSVGITERHRENRKLDPITARKVDVIDQQLNTRYANTIAFIKNFEVSRFIPLLGLDIGKLDELVENSHIYFQALSKSCGELIDMLREARARTVSRLEEDEPKPNVQRLLDQWHHDHQPGRAVVWARQHASYVNQLPDAQQVALRAILDTFDHTVEELGQRYVTSIKKDADLVGVAGRAREYFLCRDQAGLSRLLTGLQALDDHKQAAHFIPLLQGYLAELRNEPTAAAEAYQRIVEGPTHLDSLMRRFELHTNIQDWNSALQVLRNMSDLSATYKPMYADLLYATGDIDTAVEIYTEHLLANPDDLNSMMRLGKMFLECGSVEGVTWSMGYILDKDPNNHTAQQILCELALNEKTESI